MDMLSLVRACCFVCVFFSHSFAGLFTKSLTLDGVPFESGVFNSRLSDCVVGDDALILNVQLLARVYVEPGAALVNCGFVTTSIGGTSFGNGFEISVGVESGGRFSTELHSMVALYTSTFLPPNSAASS